MKVKGQVKLRKRKLKHGGWSLYLDTYSRGRRRYEYLHLYLQEERTPEDRTLNSETMRVAEAMRARRMIEVQRTGADLKVVSDRTVSSLISECVAMRRTKTTGTLLAWEGWRNKVSGWKGVEVQLKNIDKAWWQDYVAWVESHGYKMTTVHFYLARMRTVLNLAEAEGLVSLNPARAFKLPTLETTRRVFLTLDEVRRMKACPQGKTEIERAFLFSCVSGLRLSDIEALQWKDITGNRLEFRQRKTHGLQYLDLTAQALTILGERKEGSVFRMNYSRPAIRLYLAAWAKAAGITKHISFHTARHTFAVLMLEAGVDIYTLSRLMGHRSVTTTQIYADIVDARKKAAMERMPLI